MPIPFLIGLALWTAAFVSLGIVYESHRSEKPAASHEAAAPVAPGAPNHTEAP